MGVTLKDIADQVGVSYETVSRALNNRGRVGPETARRIREVASTMGYSPNALARGLRIKNTKTLGVIFPCIYENEFYAGIYRGLEDAVVDRGYVLFLCNSNFENEREAAYLRTLGSRRVDAVVLALADHHEVETTPNAAQIAHFRSSLDIPVVLVDRYVHTLRTDYVSSDHAGGARAAVEHLVQLGHRRIACVLSDRTTSIDERHEAYLEVLRRHGLPYLPQWSVQTAEIEEAAGRLGLQRLQALPPGERPTAVFVTNDLGAIGAMQLAHDLGLQVPRDLSIVGFDDLRQAALVPVPLTTVRQNLREIGRRTGQLLLARLEDKTLAPDDLQQIRVATELILRESTAPPRRA
jgi:LacI family transcriptional regulator